MSELHTRKEKRTPVTLKIKFKSATLDQFIERYSVDVSHGGIFIRTKDPLAVGTQLRFEFQLQDASPLISGDGTVVWTREFDPSRVGVAPGMGVRFDRLAPESQPVLEQILNRKGGGPARPELAFEPAPSPSMSSHQQHSGEKTRITPPNLASSLVAASQRPSASSTGPAPAGKGLSAAARNFSEEIKDSTPLPKPMPFHISAEDEFNEDVFEQPTKVASLESLLKHEEEHARAAQAEAAQRLAQSSQQPTVPPPPVRVVPAPVLLDEEEQTNVAMKPPAGSSRPRTAPAVDLAELVGSPQDSIDEPTPAAQRLDEPWTPGPQRAAALGASSSASTPVAGTRGGEPRFLENLANKNAPSPPSELSATIPARRGPPVVPVAAPAPPPAQQRSSLTVPIVIVTLLLAAAAAAIYMFVLQPGNDEPSSPRGVTREPAAGPTTAAPAPSPSRSGAPTPAPTAATKPPPAPTPTPTPAPPPAAPEAAKIDVAFDVKPAQADISIDGAPSAPAPSSLKLEIGKAHQIVASAPCFKDETVTFEPKPEPPNSLSIKLKPLLRVVRVTSEPAGALVLVDGNPAGRTPIDVRLVGRLDAKAEHVFTFRRAGFEETVTKVSPDAACATEGELGVVGLSLTLTPVVTRPAPPPAPPRRPVAAPPPRPTPAVVRPRPVAPAPRPEPVEPKPEPVEVKPEPVEVKPEPIETKPSPPPEPKPEPVEVKPAPPPEPKPEPPKPEPKPEPVETKPTPPPPAPAAPKGDSKDCDPSPDAPDWARCK